MYKESSYILKIDCPNYSSLFKEFDVDFLNILKMLFECRLIVAAFTHNRQQLLHKLYLY